MSRLSLVLAAALGFATACTKPNPASCADGFCNEPGLPFCDSDGALEGTPNACIAVECTANEFVQCRGDEAISCNSTGDNYLAAPCGALGCDDQTGCVTETHSCVPGTVSCGDRVVETCNADGVFETEACDVSCIDAPAPHCSYLSPKYLPDICDAPATEAHLDLGPFNTDIDSQCNGGIVEQVDGPEICVVRYGSITIPSGITSKVTGKRALALVADESVSVDGILDVSADGQVSGPGAGMVDHGDAMGISGGGGGGFATVGAPGANSAGPGGAANGGSVVAFDGPVLFGGQGNHADPVAVVDPTDPPAHSDGGGGGGTATLIACRGVVTVSGIIDAGGGGGFGGHQTGLNLSNRAGGGGGGSGGLVLLQGVRVLTTGAFYANGGSGGNGEGDAGNDGRRSTQAAMTNGPGAGTGHGGDGGARSSAPEHGTSSAISNPQFGHGGGGGSVGAIQIAVPAGVAAAGIPSDLSPNFSQTANVNVR